MALKNNRTQVSDMSNLSIAEPDPPKTPKNNNGGAAPVAPTKGSYITNTMTMPTYTSPTIGKQYSYTGALPTWEWDDSVKPGDWSWDVERPTYTNEYQDQINSMVDAILNREKFSYDYNTDPLYKMYAEAYTRNGQQAMKDTYAQAAARTGGLGSSYANTAAQSSYNQYMNALNDKVPELYKIAYGMYQDEGNTMRNNLGMIQGLENTAYGRYQDELGQWNTDRNFSYGQYQDLWDRYYNDLNFSYGAYQDALNQYNTDRSWDYNLWQDNLARQESAARSAYNNALAAYNAEEQRVKNYNAQVDANYQAALAAYQNALKQNNADRQSYTTTRQATNGLASNSTSGAARTVQSTGVGNIVTFGGKSYNLSNPADLSSVVAAANSPMYSEAKRKELMDQINRYLK